MIPFTEESYGRRHCTEVSGVVGALNERQRRLWAAAETMSLGYGGLSVVSRATGISRVTINQGITELEKEQRLSPDRSRRSGGGRKKGSELQPTLKPSLDAIVEPTAKGDPMSPLRWTTRSTRRLTEMLQESGFKVSKSQVCQLLHEIGNEPFIFGFRPTLNFCRKFRGSVLSLPESRRFLAFFATSVTRHSLRKCRPACKRI